MRIEAYGATDTGLVRPNNEDAWTAGPSFAAVADGVGGRPAGEVASVLATTLVARLCAEGVDPGAALRATNAAVHAAGAGNPLFTGMGCTFTALAIGPAGEPRLVHAGDSVLWRVRDGAVTRLTADHRLVAELVERGELTPEAAASDPRRNRILQWVGRAEGFEPQDVTADVRPGDRVVLATDGLDYADPAARDELLTAPKPRDEVAVALVRAALDGGGGDNVTVVVGDLVD